MHYAAHWASAQYALVRWHTHFYSIWNRTRDCSSWHWSLAQERLRTHWHDIRFTQPVCTAPVGVATASFLNCLAVASVTDNYPAIHTMLKEIEMAMGSTTDDHHRGIVLIDIDVLQLGSDRYHLSDWNRPYMRGLLQQLEAELHVKPSMP